MWSPLAERWSRHWAAAFGPVHAVLADAAGVGRGTRVLDVGCGTGELLAVYAARGAVPVGVEPSEAMAERARAVVADVRRGTARELPCEDGAFDVVSALNVLEDGPGLPAELAEARRVLAPGGRLVVGVWADAPESDVDTVLHAVARARGREPVRGSFRRAGELGAALTAAGYVDVAEGLAPFPWRARNETELTDALLMVEPRDVRVALRPVVAAAAAAHRQADGSYRLRAAARWAVGTRPQVLHRVGGG